MFIYICREIIKIVVVVVEKYVCISIYIYIYIYICGTRTMTTRLQAFASVWIILPEVHL